MSTYISMLRGINVGGKNKVPMTSLAEVYASLGFTGIKTYIQSGNVIFHTDHNFAKNDLQSKTEQQILNRFGLEVPVIIRSLDELECTISANPFLNEPEIDVEKLHVTFLQDDPKMEYLDKIKTYDYYPDRFVISGNEVYLYCPGGYGITKLSNTFFESKLKVKATTRNWRTVRKLRELAF